MITQTVVNQHHGAGGLYSYLILWLHASSVFSHYSCVSPPFWGFWPAAHKPKTNWWIRQSLITRRQKEHRSKLHILVWFKLLQGKVEKFKFEKVNKIIAKVLMQIKPTFRFVKHLFGYENWKNEISFSTQSTIGPYQKPVHSDFSNVDQINKETLQIH